MCICSINILLFYASLILVLSNIYIKMFSTLQLQMPERAVAYCDRVYEEGAQQPLKSNIYFNLLQIYLNPRKVQKEFEQKIIPVASQFPGNQKASSATKVRMGRTGKKVVEIEGADDIRFISPSGTDSSRSDGDGDDASDGGPIMLNEALELLSQRWDRINGAQALRLLPRDTKLQVNHFVYC
jgi:Vam6/Vps39-like protein vacuolar protein sorting-associated protein 39